MKVNNLNIADMAMDYVWYRILPRLDPEVLGCEVEEFAGGLVSAAIAGTPPAWFEEDIELAEIEFEDITLLEFFEEVVIAFVKMIV